MNNKEPLLQSCNILTGIGSQLLEKLHHLNIFSIYDLLLHLPFRYQDRTRITNIKDLSLNQTAVCTGTIIESHWLNTRRKVYHCLVEDNTGIINLRFFHMPSFQQKRLQIGTNIKIFGEVKLKAHGFEMVHPEIEIIQNHQPTQVAEYFTPIYPTTQGIHQNTWRKLFKQIFDHFSDDIKSLEWLSKNQLNEYQILNLFDALHVLHFPTPDCRTIELNHPFHPARARLALEELTSYSLSNQLLKKQNQKFIAKPYPTPEHVDKNLLSSLPFQLTEAQQRVIQEIRADLNLNQPMLRLLQGDVGSGKTIVCALASLAILQANDQVALMAPTDLLSEQHYINMRKWLEPLGFSVVRLSRTTPAKEKKQAYKAIATGEAKVIVGTHALFQDKVQFHQLGLVIIDEQHRFGVLQRMKLVEKANSNFHPHQLFVTATPIPRTLAMTQFSHFDVSILNQLPEGRIPIHTAVMPQDKRDLIIDRLQNILSNKGQIYWVCTRIEEDEENIKLATEEILNYLRANLPMAKVAMVHGKLKPQEKDTIMQNFKNGESDILVATTVIEVGVDVPNANIIIIENAECLGLSQLHQLRGRVGRGQEKAYCILMYNTPLSLNGQKRLNIIRQSTDGFWLAEQDLLIRGSGDIFGTQQTGFTEFKIAQIPDHLEQLKLSQQLAQKLLSSNSPEAERLLLYWYTDSLKFLNA
jgi:ATP-dependent DNA helicase RecG